MSSRLTSNELSSTNQSSTCSVPSSMVSPSVENSSTIGGTTAQTRPAMSARNPNRTVAAAGAGRHPWAVSQLPGTARMRVRYTATSTGTSTMLRRLSRSSTMPDANPTMIRQAA